MLYLVFDDLNSANEALKVIYKNMILGVPSPDLMNVDTGSVVQKDEVSPEQVIEVDEQDRHYPVFGVNAATQQLDTQSGYTTAWAAPQQRVTDSKSVFPKPSDSLMIGVTGFVEEEYNPDWFASEEIA